MSIDPDLNTTHYLPAQRVDAATVRRQHRLFTGDDAFRAVLDAVPDAVAVLNPQRQIVYANAAFATFNPEKRIMELLGKRVGEALDCLNLASSPSGCGTGRFCTTCGAARAMAVAAKGRKHVEECRILRQVDGVTLPLDLRVTATPYQLDGTSFMIFVITDIGHEKRRQVLERIFFHDIGNTAGNIRGLAELLVAHSNNGENQFAETVYQASQRLLDEVEAQRQLLAAEQGYLEVNLQPVDVPAFLRELREFYAAHRVATGRTLRLAAASPLVFTTDEALLGRVLGNMLKNALEATPSGGTVTLGHRSTEAYVHLWVHNPGVMPANVQLQLFQRSFSTKGSARGLGTYSMKLLAEQYLDGRVDFASTPDTGTIFTVSLTRQ